jgi:DNA-binding transcriptional LysR family regulator
VEASPCRSHIHAVLGAPPAFSLAAPVWVPAMELRHLRYFVAVAEELHFGRAAERLHVAQPAVSDQIRKLEGQLGTRLFRRTPRAVTLTDAGTVLLTDARRLLRQADFAVEAVRRVTDDEHTQLRLGYTPYGPPAMVPRALRRLRACARVHVQLYSGDARRLLDDVANGLLEGAVVHLPIPHQGLRVLELAEVEAMVAIPLEASSPPAGIAIDELAARSLLLLHRSADPGFHDTVMWAFRDRGLSALLDRSDTTLEQILLDVASGAGAAVLPGAAAARLLPGGISLVPFNTPAPRVKVAIAIRDEAAGPALASLLGELTAEVRRAQMLLSSRRNASTVAMI